jgi:uncharacterized membrane protein
MNRKSVIKTVIILLSIDWFSKVRYSYDFAFLCFVILYFLYYTTHFQNNF